MSDINPTKTCSACTLVKPIFEFYKLKRWFDPRCKPCRKKLVTIYRNSEHGKAIKKAYRQTEQCKELERARDKIRDKTPERIKQRRERQLRYYWNNKEKYMKVQRKYWATANGRASQNRGHRIYLQKNRHKRYAKNTVRRAVIKKMIPHPSILLCHDCKKPGRDYHHYLGYERKHWLDVVSLCRQCHVNRHHFDAPLKDGE